MNPLSPTIADMHARREFRKRALTDQLTRLVDQPVRMGALQVIVFGSFAEDAGQSTSGLDLIVVMPPEKTGKEWRRIVGTELDREISCTCSHTRKKSLSG